MMMTLRFLLTFLSLLLVNNLSFIKGDLHCLTPQAKGQLLVHQAYTGDYNLVNQQANWVFYEISREELTRVVDRKDLFKQDPLLPASSVHPDDYKYSGFDKGHLAPAADMCFSMSTMQESFYMSNMTPQVPGFNRGVWKRLESKTRDWAYEDGDLYVLTGPLFIEDFGYLKSGVRIPSHFFKIILDLDKNEYRSIAFVLRNESSKDILSSFEESIDFVEHHSGYDFFSCLPDSIEDVLELGTYGNWDYAAKAHPKMNSSKSNGSVESRQCAGITKSGKQCSRRVRSPEVYCWQHKN